MFKIPVRKGYVVEETDQEGLRQLSNLSKLGFVDVVNEYVVNCKKCNNTIAVDKEFENKGSMECTCCGRMNSIKSKRKRQRIALIHYNHIIKYLSGRLSKLFGELNVVYHSDERLWTAKIKDSRLIVLLQGVSTGNAFLSVAGNEGVCIYLEPDKIPTNLSTTDEHRFVYFLDDLLSNSSSFLKLVDSLSYAETANYLKLDNEFTQYLREITPYDFEKKFVPEFLQGIKNKQTELERLFSRLRTSSATLINSKFVPVGGPGKEDFQLINLLEYLQAGLKPDKFGEAKGYRKTRFNFQDYGTAIAHAIEGDTLFIVSTNDIQPEVWSNILEIKRKNGNYKHVILDRDTIQFLLYNLGLVPLISKDKN